MFNPKLKAGRIPYGRTTLALLTVGALVFVGYTLAKKEIRLPFSPEPYYVKVILPDAAGLDPSKEPAAGVAGASAGRVVDVRRTRTGRRSRRCGSTPTCAARSSPTRPPRCARSTCCRC